MTWVVGGKHLFCARSISDIQVTLDLTDGRRIYIDGVQKVYPIGEKIVILFADSIRLAFAIIEDIKSDFLPRIDDRLYSNPNELMRQMTRIIKHSYKKHKRHKNERVEFLIFIAPTGQYTEFGMWKLVSPSFNLIERKKPFEMLELGSGSLIDDYRDIVARNSVGVYVIDRGDGELPDALIIMGKGALRYVFAEALDYQNQGISRAMHIMLITHNDITIETLPETPDGTFPKVATSWKELKEIIGKRGIRLADCYATA